MKLIIEKDIFDLHFGDMPLKKICNNKKNLNYDHLKHKNNFFYKSFHIIERFPWLFGFACVAILVLYKSYIFVENFYVYFNDIA